LIQIQFILFFKY